MDEMKYCIYCGTQNHSHDEYCTHCHKELNPKENLFKDYLLRKTKAKFLVDGDSTIYDAIKGYLLSHLYGTVVTISIVAVAFTGVIKGSSPRLEYTPAYSRPYIALPDDNNNTTDTTSQYDQSDYDAINTIVHNYVQAVAYGGDTSSYIIPASYNIDTYFSYDFSHLDSIDETWEYDVADIQINILETDLSQKLYKEGYLLGDINVTCQNTLTGGLDLFNTLLVRVDGQWYIVQFANWNTL